MEHGNGQEVQAEEEVNAEKASIVIAELESGKSLRKAAEAAGCGAATVLDWVDADKAFAEQYAQARARGYQLLADEIIEISDDASRDYIETEHGPKLDAEAVARSRLRVDSRKWMLAKMLPKVYGDKVEHEVKGGITVSLEPQDRTL